MRNIPIVIIIISFFFLSCSEREKNTIPVAVKGAIDISNWDFEKNGNLSLNGEWEFYWNKLLTPDEINRHNPGYINVPSPDIG